MKRFIGYGIVFAFGVLTCISVNYPVRFFDITEIVSPLGIREEKPLERYAIDSLHMRASQGGPILFSSPISSTSAYTVYPFSFPTEGKRVTGVAHVPHGDPPEAGFPVIVQFRGYVDREKYESGVGTKRSAEVFASSGFMTLALDFLGYGGSDRQAENIFEERFGTYTTALDLLASVASLPMADADAVGIWGHSNGGHIALTVLTATGLPYPTTLWAPVTKPFPYSILYYSDELPDTGKYLRKELAKFEAVYDANMFAMTNYIDRIKAPILFHQGTADEAVPERWSSAFVTRGKELDIDVTYHVYPGVDHNMQGSWSTVVSRDISFFRGKLSK